MLAANVRRLSGAFCGLACGAGAAWGVSGCGHTATLAPGHRLGIALTEYRLVPDHIVVRRGELTIAVRNDGRLTHNLEIVGPSPATTVAAHTPDLAPGASTTLTVTVRPGRYPIASTVGNDSGLGERGTLTVASS